MQNKDILISLKSQNKKILKDFSRLKLLMPNTNLARQLFYISEKFELMNQVWENLVNRVQVGVKGLKTQEKKIFFSIEKYKQGVRKIDAKERRVRSQEIVVEKCERFAKRSLSKVRRMWRKSLDCMDKSVVEQNELNEKVREKYSLSVDLLDSEFDHAVESDEKSWFYIEKSKNFCGSFGSAQESFGFKNFQEDLSRTGPFLYVSEDIASFRNYDKKIKMRKKPKKVQKRPEEWSLNSQSDKLSQGLPNNVDIQEVKQALLILKKANLLEKNQNQTLLKLANLVKSSENTSNFELALQLIDLENRKNEKTKEKVIKKSQKPSKSKLNQKNFKFFLDDSITKGFPFTYNDSSSSQSKANDLIDVKLEDLLEISPLFEDLGLISADNSLIDDLNEGVIITEGITMSREYFKGLKVQSTE